MILVAGDGDLLDSDVVKHEVTHALLSEYLTTVPRWVTEGVACLLETLDNDGYEFETLSWALVHWLVDTEPKKFDAFLAGLAGGKGMWTAFSAAFPGIGEAQITAAMEKYVAGLQNTVRKTTFAVNAWEGRELLRKMPAAEVHTLRAELPGHFGGRAGEQKIEEELARARAADPAHPWMLALSGKKADLRLAIERHPEDWRSWELWFDANENDVAAIRKAAELAPDNPGVLARLAGAEQEQGQSGKAILASRRCFATSSLESPLRSGRFPQGTGRVRARARDYCRQCADPAGFSDSPRPDYRVRPLGHGGRRCH
jgi:hypothetical protein